jgi:lysine 2,3-aminomutase
VEERITPHLRSKLAQSQAVARQFKAVPPNEEPATRFARLDPLGEETHSPVKGIVHKYPNRALFKVSYRCAAHCRFCTRLRQIGTSDGDLSEEEIMRALGYIRAHPEIDDVVLSGGDPLYTPQTTERILEGIRSIPSVRVLRIDTRLPVHSPRSLASPQLVRLLDSLSDAAQHLAVFILVHVNHPDELDQQVIEALGAFRSRGFPVLSQTVFLRGVNDDEQTLEELFKTLYYLSVIPYYIYRCDHVAGLESFVCDLDKERAIMSGLRRRMSGLALPTYVVDVCGAGKLPVPLKFWDVPNPENCVDYLGQPIKL